MRAAMPNLLQPFPALVLPLPRDNGREFAGNRQTTPALDTDFFLAPSLPLLRLDVNEHINDLRGQFVSGPRTCAHSTRNGRRQRSAGPTTVRAGCLATALQEVFRTDCLAAGIRPPPDAPDLRPL